MTLESDWTDAIVWDRFKDVLVCNEEPECELHMAARSAVGETLTFFYEVMTQPEAPSDREIVTRMWLALKGLIVATTWDQG